MTSAADIEPRKIDWLIDGILAQRKLTLFSGRGGSGKSQVAISLIASLTTGRPLPGGMVPAKTGRVLLMAAEDDPDDTVIPRLIAAGADRSKVEILRPSEVVEMMDREGKKTKMIHPRCVGDVDYWNRLIDDWPDTTLIVADTLPSYLGKGVDDYKNIDVKQALEPFIDRVLSAREVGCLAIVHVGKQVKDRAIDQILGSVAYSNTARIAWTVLPDPSRPKGFIVAWMKGNNSPQQAARPFTIEGVEITHKETIIPTSKITWGEKIIDKTADEILAFIKASSTEKKPKGRAPEKKQSAKNFLMEALKKGPKPFTELMKMWRESGGQKTTLTDAATDLIGSKHIATSGPAAGNLFELVPDKKIEPDPEPPHQEPDDFWDKRFGIDRDDPQDWWKEGPPPEN